MAVADGGNRTSANTYPAPRRGSPTTFLAPRCMETGQVEGEFRRAAACSRRTRTLSEARAFWPRAAPASARPFSCRDVGITGANFLVAEKGLFDHRSHDREWRVHHARSSEIHIVIASLENTRADAAGRPTIMRLMARRQSQPATARTPPCRSPDVSTGPPRRPEDPDGRKRTEL